MQVKALWSPAKFKEIQDLIHQYCVAEKDALGRLGIFTIGVCDEIGGSLFARGHYAAAGSMASLLYANCKTYGGEHTC
jgi:hypothetical protein